MKQKMRRLHNKTYHGFSVFVEMHIGNADAQWYMRDIRKQSGEICT